MIPARRTRPFDPPKPVWVWADGSWHSGHLEAWTKNWAGQWVGIAFWDPEPGRKVYHPVEAPWLRPRDGVEPPPPPDGSR